MHEQVCKKACVGEVAVVGNYELIEKLGEGGMGVVYLARHVLLNKMFALKLINPALVSDSNVLHRFRNEARTASILNHPNVSAVREFGLDESRGPFIAMDYIEGESLSQRLKHIGPLDMSAAVLIVDQICEALEHAHGYGIVHRDIKPDNIFLTGSGSSLKATLLDFGIARLQKPGESSVRLTVTGQIMGTLPYMSPEQALGKPLSPTADIYSLGCVMFEMLTGKPPFAADTAIGFIAEHVSTAPPSLKEPAVMALDPVVSQCLEKDSRNRYQSVSGLRQDLRTVASGQRPSRFATWKFETLFRRLAASLIDAVVMTVLFVFFSGAVLGVCKMIAYGDHRAFFAGWSAWDGLRDGLTDPCQIIRPIGLIWLDRCVPWIGLFCGGLVLLMLIEGMHLTLAPSSSPITWKDALEQVVINHPIARFAETCFIAIVINWFYSAISNSSYNGTPGKYLMRLTTTRVNHEPISFFRATLYHFCRPLGVIGFPDLIRALVLKNKGIAHPFKEVLAQPFHDWCSGITVKMKD